jgi:hypothetical protein
MKSVHQRVPLQHSLHLPLGRVLRLLSQIIPLPDLPCAII